MRVFTLTHVKGGVGKTTTTVNIAYALAKLGYKTLVVDADPQCNSTFTLTGRYDGGKDDSLYAVFRREDPKSLRDLMVPVEQQENMFLVSSSVWLYRIEREMLSMSNKDKILKRALRSVRDMDYVLIDTNPSLGSLTLNGWHAADALILPISMTLYGMIGIQLLEFEMADIEASKEEGDPEIRIFGVVPTMDDRTRQSKKMLGRMKEHFQDLVFDTIIPRNIKAEEANNQSVSLFDYAPTSTSAQAYVSLVREIIEREEGFFHGR